MEPSRTVEKCPKCPEKQTKLGIPSSQVKKSHEAKKIKILKKKITFSKPIKVILDSPFSPFKFESKGLGAKGANFP